jgi:hypothetical protein
MGLWMLGSLLTGRPFLYAGTLVVLGPRDQRVCAANWDSFPEFRHALRLFTAVWGVAFLADAALPRRLAASGARPSEVAATVETILADDHAGRPARVVQAGLPPAPVDLPEIQLVTAGSRLLREQLRAVLERLELERVAGGVEQEHRPLFAGFAREPQVRLDHELRARRAEPLGHLMEALDGEHEPEMRHRHPVPVHIAVADGPGAGRPVGDELVAVEIPVHPVDVRAALGETEYAAVELAGARDVVDGNGQVEGGQFGHVRSSIWAGAGR